MAFYGFRPVGTRSGKPMVVEQFTSAETLHQYDMVDLSNSAGTIIAVDTTDTGNIGVVLSANDSGGDIDSASTGIQVVTSPDLIVFADASAACTVGLSYATTGASGAMYVDQSTAGDYSLYCIAVSPNGFGHDGDASTGLFVLKNTGTSV